jgi:hypothetical protein
MNEDWKENCRTLQRILDMTMDAVNTLPCSAAEFVGYENSDAFQADWDERNRIRKALEEEG